MRLFIGIPLEEKILNEINNLCYRFKDISKIKIVDKKNFHITLKFLGETDKKNIPAIMNAMEKAFKNEESFFITTNKISAFPSEKKAKVIWFNIDKNFEKIKEIFDKLEKNLVEINYPPEQKEYIPHITVARINKSKDISDKVINLNFEFKSKITEIVLYQSVLTSAGPIYSKIFTQKLI